jgi:hypothetical protein
MRGNSARRRAMAAGLGVALVYLGLAALSGQLSPLARRPLLDGLPTPVDYRWVSPPPELASTNQPPSAGDFTLQLTDRGSSPEVLATDDAQFTLIPIRGTFPAAAGEQQVHVTVTPMDPAKVQPPDTPLAIVGNVYRVEATYEPSGRPVETVAKPLETIVVYPLPPNLHATTHTVIASADGSSWKVSEGTDSTGNQQVEGPVTTLGYVAAAGDLQPGSASPAGPSEGRSTLGIALIVGAVCAALVGIGLLLRGR